MIIDQGKLTDGAFSNGGKFTAAGIFRTNVDLGKYVAAVGNNTGGKFAAGINNTNDTGAWSIRCRCIVDTGLCANIFANLKKIEMTLIFFHNIPGSNKNRVLSRLFQKSLDSRLSKEEETS